MPAGRPLPPRAIERLEGLSQLKNPMTSLGIEPTTCRLVAEHKHYIELMTLLKNLVISYEVKVNKEN
jgi:hypothetical protein